MVALDQSIHLFALQTFIYKFLKWQTSYLPHTLKASSQQGKGTLKQVQVRLQDLEVLQT